MKVTIEFLEDCMTTGGKKARKGERYLAEKVEADKLVRRGRAFIIEDDGDIDMCNGETRRLIQDTVADGIAQLKADNRREAQGYSPSIHVHDRYLDEPSYQTKGGWSSCGKFLHDIVKRDTGQGVSDNMQKWMAQGKVSTGMGEAIDSEGGALVPAGFSNSLLMPEQETSVIAPRARFIPITDGDSIKIPAIQESSRATDLFGGVLAYWQDEGATGTESKPSISSVTLSMNKLIAITSVTSELLEDSGPALEQVLPSLMSMSIGFQLEEVYINGTGAGQGLGIRNAACTIDVAKETGQAANTVVLDNITNMWSRLHPAGKARAIWIVSPDAFPQLLTMQMTVGTGGSGASLMKDQNIQGRAVRTILGAPVFESEHAQTLGTSGDILLLDPTAYLIAGRSSSPQLNSSIHISFSKDEIMFRARMRQDSQPWWKSALTLKNQGANTVSPFVTLQTRS